MEALKYAGLALMSAAWKVKMPIAYIAGGFATSHFDLLGKLAGMVF
jgi:hypothetical protein